MTYVRYILIARHALYYIRIIVDDLFKQQSVMPLPETNLVFHRTTNARTLEAAFKHTASIKLLITRQIEMSAHLEQTHRSWGILEKAKQGDSVILSGEQNSLELAHLIAVSRYVESFEFEKESIHIS